MNALWCKAVRDLWQERARSLLVVLAMALGIAGFAAVLASYAVLTRELDQGYRATCPASCTVRTDRVDDALLAAVRAHPEVGVAEARRTLTGRLQAGPVEWRGLQLFVIPDFPGMRVATITPEAGAWPPAPGEVLLERDAVAVARTRIGATVTLRLAGGAPRTLRVAGIVADVGQAQARMENMVYGYITPDTLAQLGEQPFLDRIEVRVARNPDDHDHTRAVAEELRVLVERGGHPVRRVDVPAPGRHPHAAIMGMLLLAMAAFGLLVLALSAILVVNLTAARMAAQVRQIGVLQALGGTRGQIAGLYLLQALVLGALALLCATPAGLAGSQLLSRELAVFLNFNLRSLAVPAWVFVLVALVGLLTPLLAAAWPVWRGTAVLPRVALNDVGVGTTVFGSTRLDRVLARVGGAPRLVLMAVRNSFRRRTRLWLTLTTLVASGLFFLVAIHARSALVATLDRFFATRRYDLAVQLVGMQPRANAETLAAAVVGVVRAEGWIATEAMLPGAATRPALATRPGGPHGGGVALHGGGAPAGDRFPVLAVPAATPLWAPEIVAGRGLQAGETDTLVANSALAAQAPWLHPGATVTVRMGPADVTWRVVGIAREAFAPPQAYVPLAFFDQADRHPDMTNTLRLQLCDRDDATIAAVRTGLERSLQKGGVRVHGSTSQAESRYGFDQHLLMLYVFLAVVAGLLAAVGGLGLATTTSLNVAERRRELAVLAALGATPVRICQLLVAESVAVGLLAWALATVLAWPLGQALGDLLVQSLFQGRADWRTEWWSLVLWLGVSLALAIAASVLPAWRVARRPLREALGGA